MPYEIVDFDDHYVSSEMRRGKIRFPRYFPCPTVDTPELLALINGHPSGLAHLGVWKQLQSWAMRFWKRGGRFVMKNGMPMNPEDIALCTGLSQHKDIVEEALVRLVEIGWVAGGTEDAPDPPKPSSKKPTSSPKKSAPKNTPKPIKIEGEAEEKEELDAEVRTGWDSLLSELESWSGIKPARAELYAMEKLCAVLEGSPIIIEGRTLDPVDFITKAIKSAKDVKASYNGVNPASAYLESIINRCRLQRREPGQYIAKQQAKAESKQHAEPPTKTRIRKLQRG